MNDFIEKVILKRASVRKFTGAAIPKDTLDAIVRAGFAAPSAVDVRPWAFVVVTERATLDALASGLPYAKMLGKAGAAIVVCGVPNKDDNFAKVYWDEDCSAATQNILLAACSLGLGAVWTAVYPEEDRTAHVRRILGLPTDIVPLNVVPIGVPEGEYPKAKDKYDPKAVHYEKW
jgi:nitroreductase